MAKSLNSIGALVIAGLLSFFHFQEKQREPGLQTESSFTTVELSERTLHRRVVESVVWGTPAVNFDPMYQAMVRDAKAGEGSNKIVYWSRLFDCKNQTLTPNPDSIYFMPFINTTEVGPVVLEIPPADEGSITGSVDDCWHMAAALVLATPALHHVQVSAEKAVLVTPDNFNRAESDMYFAETINLAGGTGKVHHYREIIPIDKQPVIRSNRDTLYSSAVFDLDAGPVTVTLPDPGKRLMSMMVIDEDHYVPAVFYGTGAHTFTKEQIDTRYIMVGIRTFVDPANPKDLEQVHALQDAIRVSQASSGSFAATNWDRASQKRVHDALVALAATLPDTKRMYGPRDQVDPVRHLIGTATGWGGNPEKDALYLTVVPSKNDGATVYKLTVRDVPVDGFWSISVYNAEGYFQKNQYDAYTLNNITAKKSADGSIEVQFGGCDGKIPNCLPTTPGWNYWVRLYRPRPEILNGNWKFPDAYAVQ